MKHLFLAIILIFLAPIAIFSQTTWKSPSFQPEAMRKVMIYAKVSDEMARRQLEDFTASLLVEKGIPAVAAYLTLKRTKFASKEDFIAYADTLGVDGLLVYEVENAENVAVKQPTVSVGVGVGGMWGGYVGASAPIAGGTKVVTMVSMSGKFYARSYTDAQWIISLSGKLDGSTDKLAYSFARTTTKAMQKDKLFLPVK